MSKLIIDYSDEEITKEYNRRAAIREALYRDEANKKRLYITNDVVKRIHAIDKAVPIIVYDDAKHSKWEVKRGGSIFATTIPIRQYGYLKRRNLITKDNRSDDEHLQEMAELFVDRVWRYERDMHIIRNKRDWVYIIGKFDVAYHIGRMGEFCQMGYCVYEREYRKNIVKG